MTTTSSRPCDSRCGSPSPCTSTSASTCTRWYTRGHRIAVAGVDKCFQSCCGLKASRAHTSKQFDAVRNLKTEHRFCQDVHDLLARARPYSTTSYPVATALASHCGHKVQLIVRKTSTEGGGHYSIAPCSSLKSSRRDSSALAVRQYQRSAIAPITT